LLLRFYRDKTGFRYNVHVVFPHPLAIQWQHDRFSGLGLDVPRILIANGPYARSPFPLVVIDDSEWARRYAARTHTAEQMKHHTYREYVFIADDESLHVLTEEDPLVTLLTNGDALAIVGAGFKG
jgi:hypothetical protein